VAIRASVLRWMEAKKPGNEAQLAELIKKRLDIDQKSAKGTDTLKSTPAPKQRATGTPTLSQVERRNDKILTLHQRSGQKIGWSMKTTCEGAKVKSYRLLSPSSAPWPKAMAKHTPLALPDFAPEPISHLSSQTCL
jgi:hypothetical protein